MPINLRSNTTVVADGSITEAKLANNSVSAAKIQTDAVIESKIATDAVTNTKIANDAITTPKILDDAITPAKASMELTTKHFFGSETELTHLGDVETSIGEFHFIKDSGSNMNNWTAIGYDVKLKSSSGSNTATFKLYLDGVLVDTETTVSTTYTPFSRSVIDPGAIADGEHLIELKLDNSINTETAYLGSVDVYLSQKS